jgi:hypothetical protein
MPSLLEQMRVRVEGHAGAGVAEDAADLDDVEADVDDQVAGEGVAEVVEAHPPPGLVKARVDGGAAKHRLGDVVVEKRRVVCCRLHVIAIVREAGTALVLTEHRGELGEKRDLAGGGARLGRDAVRRQAAAATRELMPNVHDAGGEVDFRIKSGTVASGCQWLPIRIHDVTAAE